LREDSVTFGIANFANTKDWDANRFSTLFSVPWPVFGSEYFENFFSLFHHFLNLLEPCVFAASLARRTRSAYTDVLGFSLLHASD